MNCAYKSLAKLSSAVLALVAAMGSAHAVTLADSTASLTNLKFTLVDLDPSDGIAPSVTFGSGVLSTYFQQGAAEPLSMDQALGGLFSGTASGSLGNNSYQIALPSEITLRSRVDSADLLLGESYPEQSQYVGSAYAYNAYTAERDPFNEGALASRFTLSANTALFITGQASARSKVATSADLEGAALASLFDPALADVEGLVSGFDSYAGVTMQLSSDPGGVFPPGEPYGRTSRFMRTSGAVGVDSPEGFDSGAFALSFANGEAESADGFLSLDVSATASAWAAAPALSTFKVAAIPEPSTYLLMGLGLVGIGLARSRHQAEKAS
jgi:PEP-CTERM motif-containing protein